MTDDTLLLLSFPAVGRKKITAAFDGGRITSDGCVMFLAAAERRLQLADRLAAAIPDPRDPQRVTHAMADILRARIFAIACGYEDANDLARRQAQAAAHRPAFKLARNRLPESGLDLCSQPTCSRLENLPDLRTVIRLGWVPVDLCCRAMPRHPKASRSTSTTRFMSLTAIRLFNAHIWNGPLGKCIIRRLITWGRCAHMFRPFSAAFNRCPR